MSAHEDDASTRCELCGVTFDIHEQLGCKTDAPGMTDLMVTPESLDKWLEESPPPFEAADGDW